jgi:hypothetical protein
MFLKNQSSFKNNSSPSLFAKILSTVKTFSAIRRLGSVVVGYNRWIESSISLTFVDESHECAAGFRLVLRIWAATQDVHSDRRKWRRIRPETTIKRRKSCRKRPPFPTVFHRFRAVIHHSRLRNGLNRTGKRRRFMPFTTLFTCIQII